MPLKLADSKAAIIYYTDNGGTKIGIKSIRA
jgi:hypothetical protein